MSTERHACGCRNNGTHWTVRCPEHTAEDIEYHAAYVEQRSVRPRSEWLTTPTDLGNAEGLV